MLITFEASFEGFYPSSSEATLMCPTVYDVGSAIYSHDVLVPTQPQSSMHEAVAARASTGGHLSEACLEGLEVDDGKG